MIPSHLRQPARPAGRAPEHQGQMPAGKPSAGITTHAKSIAWSPGIQHESRRELISDATARARRRQGATALPETAGIRPGMKPGRRPHHFREDRARRASRIPVAVLREWPGAQRADRNSGVPPATRLSSRFSHHGTGRQGLPVIRRQVRLVSPPERGQAYFRGPFQAKPVQSRRSAKARHTTRNECSV